MTSASIMEMSKNTYVSPQSTVRSAGVNAEISFAETMQSATAENKGADTVQKPETNTYAKKTSGECSGHKEIRKADETAEKPEISKEKLSEAMSEKENEIAEAIAEELGVSVEDVREAMEILGLSMADLMQQGNMAALTAQLSGMQMVDVVTDENLFARVDSLTQMVVTELSEVAQELGMSPEELQAAIEQQLGVQEPVEKLVAEEPEGFIPMDEMPENPEGMSAVEEKHISEDGQKTESVSGKETAGTEETGQEISEKQPAMGDTESDMQESGAEGNASLMNTDSDALQMKAGTVPAAEADYLFENRMDAEQARDLIQQVSDYVKVHHSEKASSMEIQLHPVELGTVNLQVVAKDGNISARLAVADEAVRAAMESQMLLLRESLQEQGLKIDAVEVTVATHEFEQNLEGNGGEDGQNAAKEKKGGRKLLDLDVMGQEEIDGEEISDADRLQIEMMRMGGNRMNFRV